MHTIRFLFPLPSLRRPCLFFSRRAWSRADKEGARERLSPALASCFPWSPARRARPASSLPRISRPARLGWRPAAGWHSFRRERQTGCLPKATYPPQSPQHIDVSPSAVCRIKLCEGSVFAAPMLADWPRSMCSAPFCQMPCRGVQALLPHLASRISRRGGNVANTSCSRPRTCTWR